MTRRLLSVALAGLLLAGCKSKEEKQAEEMQKAAQQMQEGMAKSLEGIAKGMAAAAGDPNAKPVAPADFKELEKALADLPGWMREGPTGERATSPVAYADASVTFKKGDAEITEKVTDSALNQLLMAPLGMVLAGNYSKESDSGYERTVTLGGYPGHESWDSQAKYADIKVVVGKRFIVEIEGQNLDDVKVMRSVLDKTDLKKLASLK